MSYFRCQGAPVKICGDFYLSTRRPLSRTRARTHARIRARDKLDARGKSFPSPLEDVVIIAKREKHLLFRGTPRPSRDPNLSFAVSFAFRVASRAIIFPCDTSYSREPAFLFLLPFLLRFSSPFSRSITLRRSSRKRTRSSASREREGEGITGKSFRFEGVPFERGCQ